MFNHKEAYFQKQIQDNVSSANESFTQREIKTLRTFEGIIGKKLLIENNTVCDIGCGNGLLEAPLTKLGMNYLGYDINDLNLETDPFPVSDLSIDLVLNYAVIEHLKDPSVFLSESFRCLKPGGALVVVTPNWQYSQDIFYNDYTHVKPYTPTSLRNILQDYCFSEVFDFPNLRCKSPFAYTNPWNYFLAAHRPFSGTAPKFIPEFLKGKAKGIVAIAIK